MSADCFWDAWPASPPSLYSDEPLTNQLGPNGKVTTFVNAQGLQLACYFWPAQQPRAVLQLNHGSGSYVMEYLKSQGVRKPQMYAGSWVERLNNAGVSVAGHDMQGLGFSEGLHGRRGYFDSLNDIIADALEFRRHIPAAGVPGFGADLPVFIAGISLGGCIALNCIQQQAPLYKGTVLLAPMVSLEKASRAGLNPYLLPLSGLVSRLLPMVAVATVNKNTLYPELQREFDEDPLNFRGNIRARAAAEYLRVTQMMLPRLSEITTPWICFHGEDDTLCDPDGSKQLLDVSEATDKELVMMPKMWHVLIKEPGNDKIIDRIVEWVQQRA